MLDENGQSCLEICRPWTFLNSSVSVWLSNESQKTNNHIQNENLIGESIQKWHLWRRKYDLFTASNKKQFAYIDTELLSWNFPLLNKNNEPIALITRNFTHLLREVH